jgi:WD40 repeat protein
MGHRTARIGVLLVVTAGWLLAGCQSRAHESALPKIDISRCATPQPRSSSSTVADPTSVVSMIQIGANYVGNAVNDVSWSPDGTSLAVANDNSTDQILDPSTGAARITYRGHSSYETAVAWAPGGSVVASAGNDGTVQTWDSSTGRHLRTMTGNSSRIYGLGWSPDGEKLATAGWDGSIRIWRASTGTLLASYQDPSLSAFNQLSWSPNGACLAAADADGTVRIINTSSGKLVSSYRGQGSPVWSVAWSPSGREIASGGGAAPSNPSGYSIRIWNAVTGVTVRTLAEGGGPVFALAWSPDGLRLASGGGLMLLAPPSQPVAPGRFAVTVWNPASGQPTASLSGATNSILALAWSPGGTLLAASSQDGTVHLWSTTS